MVDFRTSGWKSSGGPQMGTGQPKPGDATKADTKKKYASSPIMQAPASVLTPEQQQALQVLYGVPSQNPFGGSIPDQSQPPVQLNAFQDMYGGTQNNPFQANYAPPSTPLSNVTTNQGGATSPQESSIFGPRVDAIATNIVQGTLNLIEGLGNGDFQRGMYSLISLPLTSGSPMALGKYEGTIPGIIKETTPISGGIRTWNTVKKFVTNLFTREKVEAFALEGGKLAYKNVRAIRMIPTATAISAALGLVSFGVYTIVSAKSGQAMGTRDQWEELPQMMSMGARDMIQAGDWASARIFINASRQSTKEIIPAVPYGGSTMISSKNFADGVNLYTDIMEKHIDKMEEMEAEGMTPQETADFWFQYNERVEKMRTEEARIRNQQFADQQLVAEQNLVALRNAASDRSNDRRLATTKAEIKMWEDYKKRLLKLEEEAMIRQQEFWLEYRKMVLKLQEDSGRSQLGFGLF